MIIFIINFAIGTSGTILNHQSKTVSPKVNNAVTIIANDNLKIEIGNFVFSLFLAFTKVNNNKIPQIPVLITHKLEYCSCEMTSFLFKYAIANILRTTANPVGIALLITVRKNPH